MANRYGKVRMMKGTVRPPVAYGISGTVTLSGTGQDGVIVYLIDETTDTLVGFTTTANGGKYNFSSGYSLDRTHTYHVAVEYDAGGGTYYNAKSYPFITPYET